MFWEQNLTFLLTKMLSDRNQGRICCIDPKFSFVAYIAALMLRYSYDYSTLQLDNEICNSLYRLSWYYANVNWYRIWYVIVLDRTNFFAIQDSYQILHQSLSWTIPLTLRVFPTGLFRWDSGNSETSMKRVQIWYKGVTNQSKEVQNHCDIFPKAVLSISAPDKGLCQFVILSLSDTLGVI